MSLALKVGLIY